MYKTTLCHTFHGDISQKKRYIHRRSIDGVTTAAHTHTHTHTQNRTSTRLTPENDGSLEELEDAGGVLAAHGDVDVDADLGEVRQPDGDRRHAVRVHPGVSSVQLPPQVGHLEHEGDGAEDGEGEESVDGSVLWRPVHQTLLRPADVNVQQPIGEDVAHVEDEHHVEVEVAAFGAFLGRAAGAQHDGSRMCRVSSVEVRF